MPSWAHRDNIDRDWVADDVSLTCGGGAAIGVVMGGLPGSGFEEAAVRSHRRDHRSSQAQGAQSHHRNEMGGLGAFGDDSRP